MNIELKTDLMKPLLWVGSKIPVLLPILFLANCGYKSDITLPNGGTNQPATGQGGSLARFSIYQDYLYVVDDRNLNTFSIKDNLKPTIVDIQEVGDRIQTIYNFKNRLYVGSERGVYFYSITYPDSPVLISNFSHQWSCDPVVADDTLAYVTLSSSPNACRTGVNQLNILNIKTIESPKLIRSIQMNNPLGMALTKDYLLICNNAVYVYKRKGDDIELKSKTEFINAKDIILSDSLAIVTTTKGVFQFKFKNENLTFLSKI
ncbi:MAG: hypothetical protein EAZ53_04970 [Bacteroidetes bacterium]|nr:MAG: hypothetical protein EAZ53_04970 [Bacteroidota bacterium]